MGMTGLTQEIGPHGGRKWGAYWTNGDFAEVGEGTVLSRDSGDPEGGVGRKKGLTVSQKTEACPLRK